MKFPWIIRIGRARLPLIGLVFLALFVIALAMGLSLLFPSGRIVTQAVFSRTQTVHSSSGGSLTVNAVNRQISADDARIPDSPSTGLFWIDAPNDQLADFLVAHMNPDELLGQLFMLGWPRETAEGPIMDWIGRRDLGGIKVFGWNGNNNAILADTISRMQKDALSTPLGIPLLTATDQEGGQVRHIKDKTSVTPGNMALGASALPWDSYESSAIIARELRAMGVNMNFAPTVDVYVNPKASVIGTRSFGGDAMQAGLLSLAFLHGLEDNGVIATAKHFPGHGNADGDSHGMMPILHDSMQTIWNRDLVPYRMMIPEGLPAILVGHLAFPEISGDLMPASLNPKLNKDLLRGTMGFKGLIITDDLFMGGATEYGSGHGWGMSDVVLQAFIAGNDMIMLSRTPDLEDSIWTKSRARFDSDPSFAASVRESAKRVILLKLQYLKPKTRVPFDPSKGDVYSLISEAGSKTFFRDQSARAVSAVRTKSLPVQVKAGQKIVLMGQDSDFERIGAQVFPGAEVFDFPFDSFSHADPGVVEKAQSVAARADLIVFCLANPNSLEVLKNLEAYRNRIVVLSTLVPIYLDQVPWVQGAVAVYGWGPDSFRFGFEALLGRYTAPGSAPIALD